MTSQQFAHAFWKRWVHEYLPTLTRRTKWFETVKPLEKGDIVIIVDEANPRNCWPKGKVLDVVTSADGQVRKATVQTSTGIYQRPAAKLAVLDVTRPCERFGKQTQQVSSPGGSVTNAEICITDDTTQRHEFTRPQRHCVKSKK